MPERVPLASNWSTATEPSDELLSLILLLITEWIDLTNRIPTIHELRQAIRRPGS